MAITRSIKNVIAAFVFFAFIVNVNAQEEEKVTGFYFGPKVGPTIGFQQWNGFERQPMINFHAAGFIETIDEDFRGSLYGQFGYHTRGSSILPPGSFSARNQSFVFRNLSLTLGIKKRLLTKTLSTPYYFVGLRADYNVSNNLEEIQSSNTGTQGSFFYPFPTFVRKVTYGLSFGGGIEFLGSELIQPVLELTISPDVSNQYQAEPISGVTNFLGQTVTVPARNIKNLTLEVSLIVRFMRKVVLY